MATGQGTIGDRIVALIPAHDEAPRIAAVVRAAAEHLTVVVVDDGSSDDTAVVAVAAGATALVQRPNQGKGAALRAGFRWAIERDLDAVMMLDADGQHDPAEIPRFLATWSAGNATEDGQAAAPPDLVIGQRDFTQMPPIRRLANELGGRALSWAIGRRIPDNQSGFRLVSRRLMEKLVDGHEAGFEFEVEMITTAVRDEYAIVWFPIRTIYEGGPSHIQPWGHFVNFVRIVRRSRSVRGRR